MVSDPIIGDPMASNLTINDPMASDVLVSDLLMVNGLMVDDCCPKASYCTLRPRGLNPQTEQVDDERKARSAMCRLQQMMRGHFEGPQAADATFQVLPSPRTKQLAARWQGDEHWGRTKHAGAATARYASAALTCGAFPLWSAL